MVTNLAPKLEGQTKPLIVFERETPKNADAKSENERSASAGSARVPNFCISGALPDDKKP